jgi:hypothetical protein
MVPPLRLPWHRRRWCPIGIRRNRLRPGRARLRHFGRHLLISLSPMHLSASRRLISREVAPPGSCDEVVVVVLARPDLVPIEPVDPLEPQQPREPAEKCQRFLFGSPKRAQMRGRRARRDGDRFLARPELPECLGGIQCPQTFLKQEQPALRSGSGPRLTLPQHQRSRREAWRRRSTHHLFLFCSSLVATRRATGRGSPKVKDFTRPGSPANFIRGAPRLALLVRSCGHDSADRSREGSSRRQCRRGTSVSRDRPSPRV